MVGDKLLRLAYLYSVILKVVYLIFARRAKLLNSFIESGRGYNLLNLILGIERRIVNDYCIAFLVNINSTLFNAFILFHCQLFFVTKVVYQLGLPAGQ